MSFLNQQNNTLVRKVPVRSFHYYRTSSQLDKLYMLLLQVN